MQWWSGRKHEMTQSKYWVAENKLLQQPAAEEELELKKCKRKTDRLHSIQMWVILVQKYSKYFLNDQFPLIILAPNGF